MNSLNGRWLKDADVFLVLLTAAICLASLVALSSATRTLDGGSGTYVIKQAVFMLLGLIAMTVLIRLDYRLLIRHVEVFYWINIALLVLVFLFHDSHGAHGWIPMPGGFALQPSEFFKVVFILLMAKYLANEQEDEKGCLPDPRRMQWFLLGYGVLAIFLIVIEPDLGQTMMLMSVVAAAMFVHLPPRWFWSLSSVTLAGVAAFVFLAFGYPDQTLQALHAMNQKGILDSHQYHRFETFIYPERNLSDQGFQVYQAKVAIGSGQLFGKGLYKGSQTQGSWVPEQHTDFIFSVIAEELGFVGSVVVIFLFFLLIYRVIANGMRASDKTGMYICAMVAGMFTFQIFENIGMSLQLMPMTGVTLPFISYGGSSILTNFMLIGLVINVGIKRRVLSFTS